MQIEVCYSPLSFPLYQNPNAIVVVIDVLRATSAITTAFYHGVSKMIPVSSIEEALKYKQEGLLVAAERDGEIVDGFDLGNSPFAYMNERVKGKTIAITTTNGTRAIEAASSAKEIIVGSFLNLDIVVQHLKRQKLPVIFLCAGWKNKFNLEDTIYAGAVAQALIYKYGFNTECDSTIAAMELYNNAKHNLFEFLANSSHRNRLSKLDLERDIEYCLTPNQCPVLPILDGKYLVKIETHKNDLMINSKILNS